MRRLLTAERTGSVYPPASRPNHLSITRDNRLIPKALSSDVADPDQFNRLSAALADRYTLERELGRGGMATVYLADDLKHRRKVALKVLRPELGSILGAERFAREIRIAAGLTHPHILPLYDSGEAAGLLFYVMPYVRGENLRQRLPSGRWPWPWSTPTVTA